MLSTITENISTIIVSIILCLIILCIIKKMINDKKKGISSCGGNCGGCALKGSCHTNNKKNHLVEAYYQQKQ